MSSAARASIATIFGIVFLYCCIYLIEHEVAATATGDGQHYDVNAAHRILSELVDFGEVPVGSSQSRKFDIANGTSDTWNITSLKTGCACTSCDINRSIVRPGQHLTGSLTVRFPRSAGPFTTAAHLDVNGRHQAISVVASANVAEYAWSVPRRVDVNIFAENAETVSHHLEIHCPPAAGTPTIITASRPRWCTIIPITRAESGRTPSRSEAIWYFELVISSEGLPTSSEAHAALRFGFSGNDSYQVMVPVAVALGKRVAMTPSQVYIGRRRTLDPVSKAFVLTVNDPALTSESVSLVPSSSILDVVAITKEPLEGQRLRVTVLVTPRRREPIKGSILVRTPEGETVGAVPVFGLIDVDSPTVSPSGA